MSIITQKHRTTLFINNLIVTYAKAQALVEDISLTRLVEKALIAYLPPEIVIKKIKI
jgi:hypothetical protein